MALVRGYSSYRGREPWWKKLVAVLLILVILAAAAIIFLQNHVVYDDAGRARIELPWDRGDTADRSDPPDGSGSADLQITVEETAKAPETLHGAQVAARPLTTADWEAETLRLSAAASQAEALELTVKESSGRVCYQSAAARGVSDSILRADTTTASAIASMNGAWTYTVARVSCLLDPIAAKADVEGLGLKNTGGYIFYDGNNVNWLDPAKEGTVRYLCGIAEECAAMGFSEILLTDLSYPTVGKIDKIDYGQDVDRTAAIRELLTAVKETLAAEYPEVRVSVELPAAVITAGADEVAGLELAELAPLADRIYAVTTAAEAPALATAVTEAAATADFVAEVTAPEGITGSYLLLN